MTVTIRGIRIKNISLTPHEEGDKMSCTYQLISSADKVLAEQSVGGYNGLKLTPSPVTQKALDEFLKLYRNDIQILLGLDAE